jgi:hypothetical protein
MGDPILRRNRRWHCDSGTVGQRVILPSGTHGRSGCVRRLHPPNCSDCSVFISLVVTKTRQKATTRNLISSETALACGVGLTPADRSDVQVSVRSWLCRRNPRHAGYVCDGVVKARQLASHNRQALQCMEQCAVAGQGLNGVVIPT